MIVPLSAVESGRHPPARPASPGIRRRAAGRSGRNRRTEPDRHTGSADRGDPGGAWPGPAGPKVSAESRKGFEPGTIRDPLRDALARAEAKVGTITERSPLAPSTAPGRGGRRAGVGWLGLRNLHSTKQIIELRSSLNNTWGCGASFSLGRTRSLCSPVFPGRIACNRHRTRSCSWHRSPCSDQFLNPIRPSLAVGLRSLCHAKTGRVVPRARPRPRVGIAPPTVRPGRPRRVVEGADLRRYPDAVDYSPR